MAGADSTRDATHTQTDTAKAILARQPDTRRPTRPTSRPVPAAQEAATGPGPRRPRPKTTAAAPAALRPPPAGSGSGARARRSARRTGRRGGPWRPSQRCASQQLDCHQFRRRPDRRQAHGHPGDATRSQPGQQLPQYPGQRYRGRVRRMERPGCSIPDAAETAPVRKTLLHPRSRRSPDRSGANHRPRGRLVTRSLAVEYARRGVGVNAGITGGILHIDGGQPPVH